MLHLSAILSARTYKLVGKISPPFSTVRTYGVAMKICPKKSLLFVGIPFGMPFKGYPGNVFIYRMDTDNFTKVGQIDSPEIEGYNVSGFGTSISVSDDCDRLVVGAPFSGNLSNYHEYGSVFVYEFDGSEYRLNNIILPPNISEFTKFGYFLSMRKDIISITCMTRSRIGNLTIHGKLFIAELKPTLTLYGPYCPYDFPNSSEIVEFATTAYFVNDSTILAAIRSHSPKNPKGYFYTRGQNEWVESGIYGTDSKYESPLSTIFGFHMEMSPDDPNWVLSVSTNLNHRHSTVLSTYNYGDPSNATVIQTIPLPQDSIYSHVTWLSSNMIAVSDSKDNGIVHLYQSFERQFVYQASLPPNGLTTSHRLSWAVVGNNDSSIVLVATSEVKGGIIIFQSYENQSPSPIETSEIILIVFLTVALIAALAISIHVYLEKKRKIKEEELANMDINSILLLGNVDKESTPSGAGR